MVTFVKWSIFTNLWPHIIEWFVLLLIGDWKIFFLFWESFDCWPKELQGKRFLTCFYRWNIGLVLAWSWFLLLIFWLISNLCSFSNIGLIIEGIKVCSDCIRSKLRCRLINLILGFDRIVETIIFAWSNLGFWIKRKPFRFILTPCRTCRIQKCLSFGIIVSRS